MRTDHPTNPAVSRAARDVGLVVGVFVLLNLAGELVRPPFATLSDWVSLPGSSERTRAIIAGVVGAALVANGILPSRPSRLRAVLAGLFGAIAALALLDTVSFYVTLSRGAIRTPAILPASLIVVALFAALAWELSRPDVAVFAKARSPWIGRLGVIAGAIVAIPLVRMFTFGPTRYDRPASCAIVFGARVWNDGTPSDALADRVDEAISLYKRGLADKLVMSGGVEPENGISEAEVMRSRAVRAGVSPDAVLLDEAGIDTASTVRNTAALMRREGLASALVVTHYYHEPRAKMLFDRAGVQAFTVPARMHRRLMKEPYFLMREVAAYWHAFVFD